MPIHWQQGGHRFTMPVAFGEASSLSIKTHHLGETAQSSNPSECVLIWCAMAYVLHRLGPQLTFGITQNNLSPSAARIV